MSDVECDDVANLDSSSNDGDQSSSVTTHDFEQSSASVIVHDFERSLIEEVKQLPFLYDHTKGDFKDLKRKETAWDQVAEATGKSVSTCQCRWKSLRDRYVRESRKIRDGSGPKRRLWPMFKHLTFLDEFPRLYRGRYPEYSPGISKPSKPSSKQSVVFVKPASPLQVQVAANHSTEKPINQPSAREQIPNNSANSYNNSSMFTTLVDMADGCSAFGMSVSATLKTLALEPQELAKLRIQQVLYEVQFST